MTSSLPVSNAMLARDNHTMIRRLASALCCAYNIPQGDHFVVLLGSGIESDNQHAIETWVATTLRELDESTAKVILPHLVERFGQELRQWESLAW